MSREKIPLQRGDEKASASYADLIARAKKNSKARLPKLESTTSFEEANQAAPPLEKVPLSGATIEGLSALAEFNETESPEIEEQPTSTKTKELSREDIATLFSLDQLSAAAIERIAYPARSTDKQSVLRRSIESRLAPIDVGAYILNGTITQEIPVIAKSATSPGLRVAFRTIPDELEVYLDKKLSEEASSLAQREFSEREFRRRESEWALAAYVVIYQNKEWPSPLKSDGSVNIDAMDQRLALVRRISTPIFNLLSMNLTWFIERCINSLHAEALGNG